MKQIKCILLVILFLSSSLGWAQQQTSTVNSGSGFRRGVAAVMFSTIGGAVLGLSTLSFYGKPHEHTGNITTGALIGLVAGITYVSYDSSRKAAPQNSYDFSQTELHDLKMKKALVASDTSSAPLVQYQFSF